MQKILISGCLIGQKVRYHGKDALCQHGILDKWQQEGRLVAVCPEVSAGLPVPRPSSEIVGSGGGQAVLAGKARVITHNGIDRTEAFILGANKALQVATEHHIKIAILKSNSPSCGNNTIYDGTYTGKTIAGTGTTAALLSQNGLTVFNENQLHEAETFLFKLENDTSC